MISLEMLRELYDYNYWARDRQLQACVALSDEEFLRPMGNSFSSVRDTLAHLLAAEWVWLERWRGHSPQVPLPAQEFPTLASIEARWRTVEEGMRKLLAELSDERLAQPFQYTNLKGEQWTYPLWQTLLHLVNHGTYHRGQITTLLRQLGKAAVPTDFLIAQDLKSKH